MNFRLVLYEALASANVPSDQARAVVEALEHEMYTVLATKSDLAASMELFKEQLARYSAEIRQELAEQDGLTRKEFYQQFAESNASVRRELREAVAGLASQEQVASLRAELGLQMSSSVAELRSELRSELSERMAGLARKDQLAAVHAELSERMTLMATRDQVKGLVTYEQFDAALTSVRKEMELLRAGMTIRLGSMQAIGLGVLFAALKLT